MTANSSIFQHYEGDLIRCHRILKINSKKPLINSLLLLVSFKQVFKEDTDEFCEPFSFCVAESDCQILEEEFVDFEF